MTCRSTSGRPTLVVVAAVACLLAAAAPARAGAVYGLTTNLAGGFRWDAAPRTFNGNERSLNGGLRFSMQGGSYQAYRDLFTWNVTPSVTDFTTAVNQAFNAWTAPDPVTGLTTALTFTADLGTAVVGNTHASGPFAGTPSGGVNTAGAEIDLFGAFAATFWGGGNSTTQGESFFSTTGGTVRLTSGTTNYASNPIVGADITLNRNPGAVYTLDFFRRLLTHEIGHALGLADAEGDISPNPGAFIDDNYSGADPAGTLNNSWALLVNPANPAASVGLQRYTVPYNSTGTTAPGVDLLMESRGLGIGPTNPESNLVPLTNDEYGTRQFLYPSNPVPEPAAPLLVVAVAAVAIRRLRRGSAGPVKES
jgi:hypothetical protein